MAQSKSDKWRPGCLSVPFSAWICIACIALATWSLRTPGHAAEGGPHEGSSSSPRLRVRTPETPHVWETTRMSISNTCNGTPTLRLIQPWLYAAARPVVALAQPCSDVRLGSKVCYQDLTPVGCCLSQSQHAQAFTPSSTAPSSDAPQPDSPLHKLSYASPYTAPERKDATSPPVLPTNKDYSTAPPCAISPTNHSAYDISLIHITSNATDTAPSCVREAYKKLTSCPHTQNCYASLAMLSAHVLATFNPQSCPEHRPALLELKAGPGGPHPQNSTQGRATSNVTTYEQRRKVLESLPACVCDPLFLFAMARTCDIIPTTQQWLGPAYTPSRMTYEQSWGDSQGAACSSLSPAHSTTNTLRGGTRILAGRDPLRSSAVAIYNQPAKSQTVAGNRLQRPDMPNNIKVPLAGHTVDETLVILHSIQQNFCASLITPGYSNSLPATTRVLFPNQTVTGKDDQGARAHMLIGHGGYYHASQQQLLPGEPPHCKVQRCATWPQYPTSPGTQYQGALDSQTAYVCVHATTYVSKIACPYRPANLTLLPCAAPHVPQMRTWGPTWLACQYKEGWHSLPWRPHRIAKCNDMSNIEQRVGAVSVALAVTTIAWPACTTYAVSAGWTLGLWLAAQCAACAASVVQVAVDAARHSWRTQRLQRTGHIRLLASCGIARALIWGLRGCPKVVRTLATVAVCGTRLVAAAPSYGALWMEGVGRWAAVGGIEYHVCVSLGTALVTVTLTWLAGHAYALRAGWLIGQRLGWLCMTRAACVGITVADAVRHSWGSQRLQQAGRLRMLISCGTARALIWGLRRSRALVCRAAMAVDYGTRFAVVVLGYGALWVGYVGRLIAADVWAGVSRLDAEAVGPTGYLLNACLPCVLVASFALLPLGLVRTLMADSRQMRHRDRSGTQLMCAVLLAALSSCPMLGALGLLSQLANAARLVALCAGGIGVCAMVILLQPAPAHLIQTLARGIVWTLSSYPMLGALGLQPQLANAAPLAAICAGTSVCATLILMLSAPAHLLRKLMRRTAWALHYIRALAPWQQL